MNKKICPACGSKNISENKKTITIKEPFAGEESIEIIENVCKTCKSKGDFFDQNNEMIEAKIKGLKQKSVENILKYFIKNKRSLTSIERALEIPFRTLAKWKNKITKTSAAGIALLRFIRLFPWLIDVAENKYDTKKAENIMLNNAIEKLSKITGNKKATYVEEEKIYIGGAELSKNMVDTDNIVDSLNLLLEESFKKMQKSQYAKDSLVAKNTTAIDTAEVIEPVSAKDNSNSTGEKTGNCTVWKLKKQTIKTYLGGYTLILSDENKKIITQEFFKVYSLMNDTNDISEKLYYFSATFAMVSRVLNIQYDPTLVIIHSVLLTSHSNINSFLSNIINTKKTFYEFPDNYFKMIEDNLKELTIAIEQNNKTSIYEALEKYSVLGYIATGNGNYLYKKGMLKID